MSKNPDKEPVGVDHDSEPLQNAETSQRGSSGCARLVLAIVLILSLIAGLIWFAINEAQKVPEFYANALNLDDAKANAEGRQFERNLVRLQNSARTRRPWRVEIIEDQVNGWFASDLPEKFPNSIPSEIEDPRVVFANEELKLAFRFSHERVSGVVVIRADVFCTDKPNEIAIKVKDVRAGFVPLPVGPWMEKVTASLERIGVPLYWLNEGSSPVAVFSVPEHLTGKGNSQQVVIDAIELLPGKMVIAGRTVVQEKEEKKEDEKTVNDQLLP